MRIVDVMATQIQHEQFAQPNARIFSTEQSSKGELFERHGHEVGKQKLDEDWQNHLETLQKYVCELLIKNQKLRMALKATNVPQRKDGDACMAQSGPARQRLSAMCR